MKNYFHNMLLAALTIIGTTAKAQLGPLSTQYYQNPYLANPAMAGLSNGFDISMAYRSQWSSIAGAPQQQALTATYGKNRTSWGANLYLDKAGLLKQLRAMASYAYHLPISESHTLHFGISLGISQQRLATEDIKGSLNDQTGMRFNDRKAYIDGDFGIAYTTGGLKIETAIPNLDQFIGRRTDAGMVDLPTFYSAITYKFGLGNQSMQLEPKVAYRGVKGFDEIIDLGTALWIEDEQLMLMGIYHTSKSATFGLGMDLKKRYKITAMYTTQTSSLGSYSNGSFELGLGVKLGR